MTARRSACRSTAATVRGLGALLLVLALGACASASPYEGMTADQLFESAMESYEQGEWEEAIEGFQLMTSTFPTDARSDEVRFHLARAYYEEGQYLTAANEFELFLSRYPSHGRAPEASLGVCRSYVALSPHPQRDQEYTEVAVDACRSTRNQYQGTTVAEEAEELRARMVDRLAASLYQEGRFYQRRELHDAAIMLFQDVVDYYPETDWAPRGFLALYRSYRAIEWDEEAAEVRDRLYFLYPDSDAAAELRAEEDGDNGGGERASG